MLRLLRVAYELSADQPLPLHRTMPTSTIRGALGYALAQVIGREESLRTFSDRLRIFREIFSPLAEGGSPQANLGRHQPARPYVLRGGYTRPDRRAFMVELTLMGQASQCTGMLDEAMDVVGIMGLGYPEQTPCRVRKCCAETIEPEFPAEPPPEMIIEFCTPTRLTGGDTRLWGDGIPFSILLARGLDRLRDLAIHYGEGWPLTVESDIALKEASREIISTRIAGGYTETRRRSGRTRQEISMSGFIGRMHYHGKLAPFCDILAFLPWIHVGRGTVYGCGRIEYLFPE